MATKLATRFASRRLFSSGSGSGSGRILSEQEKAAENAYFKGPQPEANPAVGFGGSVTDSQPDGLGSPGASADNVSTDKYRNYAVVAGTITILGALGWYLKGTAKKLEVQD